MERILKIISVQINGISQMIRDDRYCDDVLLQVASATNALKSLGSEILKCHMKSCMVQDIKNNNLEIVEIDPMYTLSEEQRKDGHDYISIMNDNITKFKTKLNRIFKIKHFTGDFISDFL